ncbi:MAG: BMC domain-containing protein [Iodobacter sp.]
MINALGLIEVRGFVTAIEAADAMLKSANVRLMRQYETSPGLISLVVEGDIASCRAAVDAGVAAAARLGEIVSRQEIGRPDPDIEQMVLTMLAPQPKPAVKVVPAPEVVAPVEKAPEVVASVEQTPEVPVTTELEEPVTVSSEPEALVAETAAGFDQAVVLAAVAASANGLTLAELVAALPGAQITRRALENLCKTKYLAKRLGRYCKP